MKLIITGILGTLIGSTLLVGCASEGTQKSTDDTQKRTVYTDDSYTPTGSLIPRKKKAQTEDVTRVDKQALENDRVMNNSAIPMGR